MGSMTAQPAEETRGERWDAPRTARYCNFGLLSNQCLERIWAKLFDLSQSMSASEPA